MNKKNCITSRDACKCENMCKRDRAQCLVIRGNKILMVKHSMDGREWYCSPGGGVEKNETPEQAALRELKEECNVDGKIIKKTSKYVDPYDETKHFHTFHIDIGAQEPSLGIDPEFTESPILVEVAWKTLEELSKTDRTFLWASGLLSIPQFYEELTKKEV